ncbi:MAG: 1-acyl-sn-glycerol-3-phosphate acyltransferase, partial [Bacteroidales bacterium]
MKISVSETIKAKNPKLYKNLPKWIIRFLERIIHQDEINEVLEKYGHLPSIDFAQEYFKYLRATVNVIHEENIPKRGRYIIACNHPLGGLDGVALISLCGQYRRDIKFPVNDLLMYVEPLREVFIPINKHGKTGTDAVTQFNQAFESDDLILYFPAGLCSRKHNGIIRDPVWKKTIITKAKQTKRDIIPVFFDGRKKPVTFKGMSEDVSYSFTCVELNSEAWDNILNIARLKQPILYRS